MHIEINSFTKIFDKIIGSATLVVLKGKVIKIGFNQFQWKDSLDNISLTKCY